MKVRVHYPELSLLCYQMTSNMTHIAVETDVKSTFIFAAIIYVFANKIIHKLFE